MDEHELSRLLDSAAAEPSRPLDHDAIAAGVRGRRRRRHRVIGAGVAMCLAGAAAAAFALVDPDDTTDVRVVDPPATTTSTTEPAADEVEPVPLESVPPQDPIGVAVQQDTGLTLVGLDGVEGWTGPLQFGDLSTLPGLESEVLSRLPVADADGLHWWDPSGTRTGWHPSMGVPLAYGAHVGGSGGFLTGASIEVSEAAARWWVSSDLRVVTWTECESGCPHHYYDSLTDESGEVGDGCWVAAWSEAEGRTLICDDGTTVVPPDGGPVEVSPRPGNQPVRAVAAWSNGVVWIDEETCHAHEAVVVRDGEVRSLLADTRWSAPSAVPLAIAPDGRMVVHLNAAACDAADPDMGIYLVDLETRERELVWEGAALSWEVRAWWPAPRRAPVVPEGVTEANLADLEGRFLMFGTDGIAWLEDGELDQVWDQPVDEAYPDGSGGIVFQERGIVGEGTTPAVGGAIRWLSVTSSEAVELVPGGTGLVLHQLVELEGEPTVLFTRRDHDPGSDLEFDEVETLFALGLSSQSERVLAETGARETHLNAIDMSPRGLVLSTCHISCGLWTDLSERDDLGVYGLLFGLSVTDEVLAFVEYGRLDATGYFADPMLRLSTLDAETLARVRLPDLDRGGWAIVDLAADSRSATVGRRADGGPAGTLLVTGLDTPEPRVQIVATDQALRFG